MINSAGFQPQDPNAYAMRYASSKGISIEEAKGQLKAQYGDSSFGMSGSVFSMANQSQQTQTRNFSDYFTDEDLAQFDSSSVMDSLKGMFQRFADMLKGNDGPQNEGDPEPHKVAYSNSYVDGPQRQGDPEPHKYNNQNQFGGYNSQMQERFPQSAQEKDAYARQYAEENDITFEEAKEILASMAPKMEQIA